MIELVPIELFMPVYFNTLLCMAILILGQTYVFSLNDTFNFRNKEWYSWSFVVVLIFFIGVRPVSGKYFGDMRTYELFFNAYANGASYVENKDMVFEYFLMYSSYIMTSQMFFILCSFLYIWPLYVVCKRFFGVYWFYGFFMLVASMSFLAYGTNGIRNGLATTTFLFAMSCKKWQNTAIFFLVAFLVHKSMALPISIYILTLYHNKTENYLRFWLLCIPLSLVVGGTLEGFFLGLGFGEEDFLKGYLTAGDEFLDTAVKTGFRWDFLLYSSIGVLAGWYFIIKMEYDDAIYRRFFNIYLITNGFWVLVIRANFSNRFAYLSWFMLGIIIIYPLLKMEFFRKQHQFIGKLIFIYFIISYMLNFILSKK